MATFKPKLVQPGDLIKADEWNSIQQGLLEEISRLESALTTLRAYVDNMGETLVLTNLESTEGKAYGLEDPVPGEVGTYQTNALGLITKQWLPVRQGVAEVCRYGLTDFCEQIYYWAGAEKGNKKTLEVTLQYVDGTSETMTGLFVHDRAKLAPKGTDNPYTEYLLSPNELVWYRYMIVNPHPNNEVRYISFRNTDPECTTRIGNVIHLRLKIKPISA